MEFVDPMDLVLRTQYADTKETRPDKDRGRALEQVQLLLRKHQRIEKTRATKERNSRILKFREVQEARRQGRLRRIGYRTKATEYAVSLSRPEVACVAAAFVIAAQDLDGADVWPLIPHWAIDGHHKPGWRLSKWGRLVSDHPVTIAVADAFLEDCARDYKSIAQKVLRDPLVMRLVDARTRRAVSV